MKEPASGSKPGARALRVYLIALMAGLVLQGAGSLLFRADPDLAGTAPSLVRGLLGIDPAHAWLHVGWGAAALAALLVARGAGFAVGLAMLFGVFYTAFGIWGVLVHHPLGLELDAFENGFHLVAGPLTLLLGTLAAAGRRHRRVAHA